MKQLEFFDIPSPCIGVCESGPRGYCRGCYRSREERLYWYQIDDSAKREVIRACQIRQYRHQLSRRPSPVEDQPVEQLDLLAQASKPE